MNHIERIDCPSCKLSVLLSYVPTSNQMLRDVWTCPHCQGKHPSSREGAIVVAVRGQGGA